VPIVQVCRASCVHAATIISSKKNPRRRLQRKTTCKRIGKNACAVEASEKAMKRHNRHRADGANCKYLPEKSSTRENRSSKRNYQKEGARSERSRYQKKRRVQVRRPNIGGFLSPQGPFTDRAASLLGTRLGPCAQGSINTGDRKLGETVSGLNEGILIRSARYRAEHGILGGNKADIGGTFFGKKHQTPGKGGTKQTKLKPLPEDPWENITRANKRTKKNMLRAPGNGKTPRLIYHRRARGEGG